MSNEDRRRWPAASTAIARALVAAAILATLGACAGPSRRIASEAELTASGWREPARLAPVGDFDAYVDRIRRELGTHRVAFDPAAGDAELARVAPFRLPAGAHCGGAAPRGIAVLVHGLSDTAFAMRDLAGSFAALCFEARVLLLPGHGTRAADLMTVDHRDWLAHVRAAVAQAASERDTVVVAGFSLGAALALAVAVEAPERVDAVIGLSPAYRIRSSGLARQARWVAAVRPWLDSEPREEFARYEAMPTRGIAATMDALATMHAQVRARGGVPIPWMLVQSADDEVIDPRANRAFFAANAKHDRSLLLAYYSDPAQVVASPKVVWTPAADPALRVVGLSHLALHIAPDNTHYGVDGSFRNCGSPPFRDEAEVLACQQAPQVWYGVGGMQPPPGAAGARATFNPHFAALEHRLGRFLDAVGAAATSADSDVAGRTVPVPAAATR